MIKALRKKFILLNMLLVSLIIISVFTTLCILNIVSIRNSVKQSLYMSVERIGDNEPIRFDLDKQEREGYRFDTPSLGDISTLFSIEITSDSEIVVHGFYDLGEETIELLIRNVYEKYESGIEEGILEEYNLRFLVRNTPSSTRIAFSDYASERASIIEAILTYIGFMCLVLILFFVMAWFLSSWALRPVEQAWQQQRRFLSDASHELKTPLTVILANTNILLSKKTETVKSQEKWIRSTEYEAERMKTMVEQMLFLAKNDEDSIEQVYETVQLSSLLEETLLSFESVAFEAQVELKTELAPQISILGNREELWRMVGVLLDNAIKYAANERICEVTLQERDDIIIKVTNTADEIEQEKIDQMFERFYRAEASRTAAGYGLGLPIAKTIAEKHGGKILAHYDHGEMIMEVHLPKKKG